MKTGSGKPTSSYQNEESDEGGAGKMGGLSDGINRKERAPLIPMASTEPLSLIPSTFHALALPPAPAAASRAASKLTARVARPGDPAPVAPRAGRDTPGAMASHGGPRRAARDDKAPASEVDTKDPRRLALLADPDVALAIGQVARSRGVKAQDVDDVVQGVLALALTDPHLPLDSHEAGKRYLCTVGRNDAIDGGRKGQRDRRRLLPADEVKLTTRAASPEDARLARVVTAEGTKRKRRATAWLRELVLGGATNDELAQEQGASAHRVLGASSILKEDLRGYAGGTAALTLLVLVVLVGRWLGWVQPGPDVAPVDSLANTVDAGAPVAPPVPTIDPGPPAPSAHDQAVELRAKAHHEVDLGQWDLAADDLDRADEVDPGGATADDLALRDRLRARLDTGVAKPRPAPYRAPSPASSSPPPPPTSPKQP